MLRSVTLLGTGLIGASVGLALRASGFAGEIAGWDPNAASLRAAREMGAITSALPGPPEGEGARPAAGVVVLAGPVLSTLDWMERLAPWCGDDVLLTDVGSTKLEIARAAQRLFNRPGAAAFLPGHPMAGKERGGPELAEAELFAGAQWLFTPVTAEEGELAAEWRACVQGFGARVADLDAQRHDELCAWVSHLPQMLSTALASVLEEQFGDDPIVGAVGGRALRETTRLGSSPYSMWRDIALTNAVPIGATLQALEQKLAHVRENLRTPELREEFRQANRFRERRG